MFFSYENQKIKNLHLDFGLADVVLIPGDFFSVEARDILVSGLECRLEDDETLFVANTKRLQNAFSRKRKGDFGQKILLTVPKNVTLDSFMLKMSAGNFASKDFFISYKKALIQNTAGNITLDVSSEQTDLICSCGNVSLNGKFSSITKIDVGMGSVFINLCENNDFSFECHRTLGEFKINNEKQLSASSGERKESHFAVQISMGSLSIRNKS